MANAWKCDQCGKVIRADEAVNWIHVSLVGGDARTMDSPLWKLGRDGAHFCSLECLTSWAVQASGLIMHHIPHPGADDGIHVMTPAEHRAVHEEGR